MEGRSLSGYQQKRVWLNDGAGQFKDVAQAVGATDTYDGRAVALADLCNDGVLDVVVANQRGPLLLYRNTVDPRNQWIEFDLEGTKSNRSAIGAEVTVRGTARRRSRRSLAATVSPRRTIAVCTSVWAGLHILMEFRYGGRRVLFRR